MKDEDKVSAIYDAVIALTGEVGLAGLKMSAIARHAEIASGTLYIYFKSKDELLNQLYHHLKKQGSMAILPGLSELPVKLRLRKLWDSTLNYQVSYHREMIFLEQFIVSPFISKENKAMNQRFRTFLNELLDQGKREMIIKNHDNNILIAALSGYARNLSLHVIEHQIPLNEHYLEHTFNICWDAIRA